jgi:hypothetical protein
MTYKVFNDENMYEGTVGNLLCGVDMPISGLKSRVDGGNAYVSVRFVDSETQERYLDRGIGQRQGGPKSQSGCHGFRVALIGILFC